jgi:hypothetical protein
MGRSKVEDSAPLDAQCPSPTAAARVAGRESGLAALMTKLEEFDDVAGQILRLSASGISEDLVDDRPGIVPLTLGLRESVANMMRLMPRC